MALITAFITPLSVARQGSKHSRLQAKWQGLSVDESKVCHDHTQSSGRLNFMCMCDEGTRKGDAYGMQADSV